MKHKQLIGFMSAIVLAIGTAYAAGTAEEKFNQLDADQSGTISAQEAESYETLSKNWGSADTNQDGAVDMSEFSAFEEMQKVPAEEGGMEQ